MVFTGVPFAVCVRPCRHLRKVVNDDFGHEGLHAVRDEFKMQRVYLIIILRLFADENGVQRDLITLVNDRSRTTHHFADVEMSEAGNVLEESVSAGDDLGGGGHKPE